MIKAHSREKPNIQGLLLLDCWEPQVHEHLFKDKFYINLIENLLFNITDFWYVVNSASRLKIELNDTLMVNTFKVCNYRDDHPIIRNLLAHAGDEKTSTLILRYLCKDKQTINLINPDDFVWLCTKHLLNKVQNWLVVGHTWQMCTHSHAIGLNVLGNIASRYPLNFYATDYSFCTMTEQTATLRDFEQDSLKWELIENFGYRLLPLRGLDKYQHGIKKSH
jgi:hypothetical protein